MGRFCSQENGHRTRKSGQLSFSCNLNARRQTRFELPQPLLRFAISPGISLIFFTFDGYLLPPKPARISGRHKLKKEKSGLELERLRFRHCPLLKEAL
jgi:hypothetical protein